MRLAAGRTEIHRPTETAPIYSFTLARRLGTGKAGAQAELALATSSADEGFTMASAGVEWRMVPRFPISPLLAAHLGFLVEPEFAGAIEDVWAGVSLRANRRIAARVALSRGMHGDASGPHSIMAGLEFGVSAR